MAKKIKPIGGAIVIPPHRTDFIAGAVSGLPYEDLGIDWSKFLPTGETQQIHGVDLYNCVSNGSVDSVGAQIEGLLSVGLVSQENLSWLIDNHYFENGKINLSERHIAKLSGTDPKWGNTWQNVADATRHYGVVPESLWPSDVSSVSEFYQPVPQKVIDLGLDFLERFDVSYEIVAQGYPINREVVEYHLKQAPLQIIGFVCSGWNTQNPVKSCPPGGGQHCTMLYDMSSYDILDSYPPYLKKLADDYYINFVGKIIIKDKGNTMMTISNANGWLKAIDGKDTHNTVDLQTAVAATNKGDQTTLTATVKKYLPSNKTLLQSIINYINSLIKNG